VLGTSQERHTGGSGALQGEGGVRDVPDGEQAGQEGPVAASGGELVKLSMNELLRLGLSRLPQTSSGEEATVAFASAANPGGMG